MVEVTLNNLIARKVEQFICVQCQQPIDMKARKKCSGCHVTYYCSRECQVAHWPVHRKMCKEYEEGMPIIKAFRKHRIPYHELLFNHKHGAFLFFNADRNIIENVYIPTMEQEEMMVFVEKGKVMMSSKTGKHEYLDAYRKLLADNKEVKNLNVAIHDGESMTLGFTIWTGTHYHRISYVTPDMTICRFSTPDRDTFLNAVKAYCNIGREMEKPQLFLIDMKTSIPSQYGSVDELINRIVSSLE